MSPNDVLDFFYTLVDDEPDTASAMILMDAAYTKRNDSRFWTFLLALDATLRHGSGDTWQTDHALPADFEEPYRVFGSAGGGSEYDPVPYEGILNYVGAANRYSIDYGNSQLRVTGPGNGNTLYLWYKKHPTSLIGLSDAEKAAAGTIIWPKRFCPILAFDMAQIQMGGIDADDIARQQVPWHSQAHKELYHAMITWDTHRRMKMFGNSATPQNTGSGLTPADVVDM